MPQLCIQRTPLGQALLGGDPSSPVKCEMAKQSVDIPLLYYLRHKFNYQSVPLHDTRRIKVNLLLYICHFAIETASIYHGGLRMLEYQQIPSHQSAFSFLLYFLFLHLVSESNQ